MENKKIKHKFLLEYEYAIGLTLGLLMGAWMGWACLPFIVLIWFLVLIERWFFR